MGKRCLTSFYKFLYDAGKFSRLSAIYVSGNKLKENISRNVLAAGANICWLVRDNSKEIARSKWLGISSDMVSKEINTSVINFEIIHLVASKFSLIRIFANPVR